MNRSVLMALAAAVLVAADGPAGDEDRLQGTWVLVRVDKPSKQGGREIVEFQDKDGIKMTFDRGKVATALGGNAGWEGYYLLSPNDGIPSIEISHGVMLYLGIYRFEDEKLTLCLDQDHRPSSFTPGLGSSAEVLTFRREKRRP
jgi:uncharacterized protein (TIGR03067 family)